MTERGSFFHEGNIPVRGLTSPSINPYANEGAFSMAAEGTHNEQRQNPDPGILHESPLVDHTGRPFPQARPLITPDNPNPEETVSDRIARLTARLKDRKGGDPTPEEFRLILAAAEYGVDLDYERTSQGDPELDLGPRGNQQRRSEREAARQQLLGDENGVRIDDENVIPLDTEWVRRDAAREAFATSGPAPDAEDSAQTLRKIKVTEEQREEMIRKKLLLPRVPDKDGRRDLFNKEDAFGDREINCVEQLVFEIMDKEQDDKFKPGGAFELLNERGEFQAQNFLHWVRHWMMYWHSDSPDSKHDFLSEIVLQKNNGQLTLGQMIKNPGRYFRSWLDTENDPDVTEDFPVYYDLVEQIKRETWFFGTSREWDIAYNQAMGSDEELPKTLTQMFYLNPFTKTVWDNKSSLYWVMNMPQKFKEVKPGQDQQESRVGRALNNAYLAYYNLGDREELQRILQDENGYTPLLDREVVKRRVKEQMIKDKMILQTGEKLNSDYLDPTEYTEDAINAYIDKVTDADIASYLSAEDLKNLQDPNHPDYRDLKEKEKPNLMAFINLFNAPSKSSRIKAVVRGLIQESIIKKYDLYVKDDNGEYIYDTKVPEDDRGRPQKDEDNKPKREYKLDKTTGERMRMKDETSVNFADTFAFSMARWTGAGARNDVNAVGFDAWSKVMNTQEYRTKQSDRSRIGALGNPYTLFNIKGLSADFMNGTMVMDGKTPLEVMEDMLSMSKEDQTEYYKKVSQLVFADNAMRSFTIDHFNRVYAIYSQIMNTEEFKLEKFTHYSIFHGFEVDRGPFEQALKEKMFKPMRYAWSTYAGLDLSKRVRAQSSKDGSKFEEMYLAEQLFGRELLDNPEFYVADKSKHKIKIDADNWHEKIDWSKLNNKKTKHFLWRRVALGRLAAEIYMHRDRHNKDTKYTDWFYESVAQALETIQADISGNEFDFRSVHEHEQNFTKEEMKWFREKAGITEWQITKRALLMDIGRTLLGGVGDVVKDSLNGMKP